ncbi:hypothetical protein GCM10023346_48140 [Arthrobacter gyeryongensis]|uniref:Uncharacterized protein n=1 Tax=Arthrobacter gyeryongensis TaxID=1650592 RepID=A0ABP9SWQ6_9MICC
MKHATGRGGYGPAFERETEPVRQDLLSGFVSFTADQTMTELQIDDAETYRLRARLASA